MVLFVQHQLGLAGDLAKGEGTVGMKAGDLLDKLPSAIQKVLRHA